MKLRNNCFCVKIDADKVVNWACGLVSRISPWATRLPKYGDIAQLVERLNGIEKVEGSTPSVSTRHFGQVEKVSGSNPLRSTTNLIRSEDIILKLK